MVLWKLKINILFAYNTIFYVDPAWLFGLHGEQFVVFTVIQSCKFIEKMDKFRELSSMSSLFAHPWLLAGDSQMLFH